VETYPILALLLLKLLRNVPMVLKETVPEKKH
jgi:hypothetical protein